LLSGRHIINLALAAALVFFVYGFFVSQSQLDFWLITGISLLLGILIIIPIGGADMPVVISMLNSYSGWAAAGIGFTLGNSALIITGALVGSSGAILCYRMCARHFGADHHRGGGRLFGRVPLLHHVPRDEPELLLGHPRRLRRRGRGA